MDERTGAYGTVTKVSEPNADGTPDSGCGARLPLRAKVEKATSNEHLGVDCASRGDGDEAPPAEIPEEQWQIGEEENAISGILFDAASLREQGAVPAAVNSHCGLQ